MQNECRDKNSKAEKGTELREWVCIVEVRLSEHRNKPYPSNRKDPVPEIKERFFTIVAFVSISARGWSLKMLDDVLFTVYSAAVHLTLAPLRV